MTITPTKINRHPELNPAFRFDFDVSTETHLCLRDSVSIQIISNSHVLTASVDRTPMKLARSPNIQPVTIRIRFPSNPGGSIVIG